MKHFFIIFILITFSGCSSTGGFNLLNMIYGRKAAEEKKTKQKEDGVSNELVLAALAEVYKSQLASSALPESEVTKLVKRFVDNSYSYLSQGATLTSQKITESKKIVEGLLQENQQLRREAESRQIKLEQGNEQLSQELESIKKELKELSIKREKEAEANLSLANELRAATLWKWGATGFSALLGVAAFLYRANAFGMASKVAEGLVSIERKHGADTADLTRSFLDQSLDTAEKTKIFSALLKLAPDIARRVSTS